MELCDNVRVLDTASKMLGEQKNFFTFHKQNMLILLNYTIFMKKGETSGRDYYLWGSFFFKRVNLFFIIVLLFYLFF